MKPPVAVLICLPGSFLFVLSRHGSVDGCVRRIAINVGQLYVSQLTRLDRHTRPPRAGGHLVAVDSLCGEYLQCTCALPTRPYDEVDLRVYRFLHPLPCHLNHVHHFTRFRVPHTLYCGSRSADLASFLPRSLISLLHEPR